MMEIENQKLTTPLNVLVVEDNQVDRRVLEAMLTESPYLTSKLVSTTNLKEAMEELGKINFDVIVLDLNLPDSLGPESLQTIRAKFPHIPIVINTGAYEDDLGLKTLRYGAQDFLVKGKYNSYVLHKALHYAIERKKLEQQLAEVYDNLIQSEKMKVIGTLAGGVAHEVKNPLATILYGITFLKSNVKSDHSDYEFVLQTIHESIDRASTIINDLLDFSSHKRIKAEPADIHKVIDRAMLLVKYDIEKNHIKIKKDYAANMPETFLDINRITQVLINLFLNAIQAMTSAGQITVTTKLSVVERLAERSQILLSEKFHSNENVIIISIEDQGSGIAEENITKIFDPFFTSKRAKGGVGLGLSVSKTIIESHNGLLLISNREEGGVRANLILKLITQQ